MDTPIRFERDDFCTECNSPLSIELYNIHNNPINYTLLLNNMSKIDSVLNKHELKCFRCKICGKTYLIDWVQVGKDRIPIPLRDNLVLDKFEDIYLRGDGE